MSESELVRSAADILAEAARPRIEIPVQADLQDVPAETAQVPPDATDPQLSTHHSPLATTEEQEQAAALMLLPLWMPEEAMVREVASRRKKTADPEEEDPKTENI